MTAHARTEPGPTRGAPRSVRGDVLLLVGARVVAGFLSAVVGLAVPRALSLADYGNYGIAIGVAGMLVVLSDLGLTTATARFLAEGRADRHLVVRAAAVRFASAAVAGLALSGAGVGLHLGWFGGFGRDALEPAYLVLAGMLVFSNSLLGVCMGLLPTLRRVNALLVLTVAQPALEMAGVLSAIVLGLGAEGIIVASASAALVTGTVGLALVVSEVRKVVPVGTDRAGDGDGAQQRAVSVPHLLAYSRAMFFVAISFTLFGQVDQLVIYAFHGAETAAGYIASWRLIVLLHLPGLAAATVVAPRLAGGGVAARGVFGRWLVILLAAYVGVVAISVALAPALVPAALGSSYAGAAPIFASLGIYAVLTGIAPHVTMAANFLGGARRRVRLGAVTVVVNLVLDLLLVPPLGVYGAAIATTVAFSWYVAAHALLSWRLLGGQVRPGDAIRQRRALLTCVATIVAAGLAALLAHVLYGILEPHVGNIAAVLVAGSVALGAYMAALYRVVAATPAEPPVGGAPVEVDAAEVAEQASERRGVA